MSVNNELQPLLDRLESERGAERIDELVERLGESRLTQTDLKEMAQQANNTGLDFKES